MTAFLSLFAERRPRVAAAGLFRKSAVERLSSPEQLDRLVIVTDPLGWLVLATVGALLLALLSWGIFGAVPYNVMGEGMLVSEGGRVFNAMAPTGGVVEEIRTRVNARVERGEVLVVLRQDALRAELANARALLGDREAERAFLITNHETDLASMRENFAQQRVAQREIIAIAQERKTYFESILTQNEDLLARGLVTRRAVEEARQQANQMILDMASAANRMLELDARLLDIRSEHIDRLGRLDQQIGEATRKVEELELRLARTSYVTAPASGTVTEVRAAEEAVVTAGAPLVSVASAGQDLEVILYVPTNDGKKVRAGMSVRIAPATVRKEEFGTLVGTVFEVSEFPATREGMASVLQNMALVERFSQRGAPYVARVHLQSDPATPSGFAWSSAQGPNLQITAGTTASAEITVREVPPIFLLMPFLQQLDQ